MFVNGVGSQPTHEWIMDGIIALSKRLRLVLVAEGIESSEQEEWLTAHGCDCAQGYHFGRPMRADELIETFWSDDPADPSSIGVPHALPADIDASAHSVGSLARW